MTSTAQILTLNNLPIPHMISAGTVAATGMPPGVGGGSSARFEMCREIVLDRAGFGVPSTWGTFFALRAANEPQAILRNGFAVADKRLGRPLQVEAISGCLAGSQGKNSKPSSGFRAYVSNANRSRPPARFFGCPIHHSSFIIHHSFSSSPFILQASCFILLFFLGAAATAADTPPADAILANPFYPVTLSPGTQDDRTTVGTCGVPAVPSFFAGHGSSTATAAEYFPVAFYVASARWAATATNPSTGVNGDPITLTFSFPADGITIAAFSGLPSESPSPNILNQKLDQQFLSREIWQEQFRLLFRRWSLLGGIQYVESTDDGAAFGTAPGLTGARGDIRIGGHHIDGATGSNVLAYSSFPDASEMVLDTDNTWSNPLNNYRFLRNVCGHELGHGLGLDHPENRADTQWLLEPVISTAFDGPQEDDIRGIQRLYGDSLENNDTSATATDLGTLGASQGGAVLLHLSTDRLADIDWFKFDLSTSDSVTITVTPVGTSYTVQAQGLPPTGTVNAQAIADLRFVLFQANATTVIADVNATAAGSAETVTATLTGGQTYFIKLFDHAGTDDVQRYTLAVRPLSNTAVPPRAVAPYDRETLTGRVYVSARESYDPDHATDLNAGILQVEWDMDNNGSFEARGADATHLYAIPGFQIARMRVTDSDGLTSTVNFTILVRPPTETRKITLTAPNSGVLIVGAPQTITWTSTAALLPAANIRIDLSRDGGFTWNLITAATPNTGSFTWPAVTGPATNTALIRLADASDPVIADACDSNLAIASAPTLTLTAPAGGETVNLNYPLTITWTATGVSAPILIELSRDSGATFTTLAATAPNTGSFTTTATAPAGTQNRIRITDSTNAAITATGGDFTFAATPTLTLTAPIGGETIVQGTVFNVTWTSAGSIAQVNLEFSADAGATWMPVTANAPNTGSFAWTVTPAATVQGRIRIADAAAPAVVNAASPANFTIPPPTLTVLTPNGGQTFRQGDTRTISWATTGTVAQVDLEVSTDNGATWTALSTALANSGSFAWFIAQAPTVQALVRVKDTAQPAVVNDVSDAVFTILTGTGLGTITVLSPNGGETLPAASAQTIRWSTTGFVPTVKIEVTVNGGATWQVLTTSTPSAPGASAANGFNWTTPGFFYTNLRVRITDTAAPAVTDQSDAAFTIGVRPRKKSKACAVTSQSAATAMPFDLLALSLLCGAACALARRRSG